MKTTGLYLTLSILAYSLLSNAQVIQISKHQSLSQTDTTVFLDGSPKPLKDTFCMLTINGVSVIPASCPGACDASIEISAFGGMLPYSYWTVGDSCEGFITIFVSDAIGCIDSASVFIYSDSDLEIFDLHITPSTNGQHNGMVEVEADNGIPPYLYSIDGVNYQFSPIFNNLAPGSYCITVLDGNGCYIKSDTFWVENTTSITSPIVPISLYPNPVNSTLYVNGKTAFHLDLMDADGVVVKSSPESASHALELAELPRGLYLVRVRNEIGFIFHKILLQ